jgi:two-component system nitrogen regulation response regulator GlnG
VLAATNRDLERRVAKGHFREDLFHRLNVIRIELPPLNERIEDLDLLCKRFLRQSAKELQVEIKRLSDDALRAMKLFQWPGNVRQLENVCRWLTVMAPASMINLEDLPREILSQPDRPIEQGWEAQLTKVVRQRFNQGEQSIADSLSKQFESILLKEALTYSGGHRQNAAKLIGWGRNTLTRKLKDLNIN